MTLQQSLTIMKELMVKLQIKKMHENACVSTIRTFVFNNNEFFNITANYLYFKTKSNAVL